MENIEEIITNNEIEKLTNSIINKDSTFIKLQNSKWYYLIYAIESNCTIDMIKLLLPFFSNLNYEYKKKAPLFSAIENHKFNIADLLLKEGANINIMNSNKENVLFYLLNINKLDKSNLKYLLTKNTVINYKFKNLHVIEYLLLKTTTSTTTITNTINTNNNNTNNNNTNNNNTNNNNTNNNNINNNNTNNNNINNNNTNNNNNNNTNNDNNTNNNIERKVNLIDNNEKIYELVKIIFESLTFTNEFIINIIYLYKRNALKMSYIKEEIDIQNKTVKITKSMYNLAIKGDNKKVIELLLKYDNKDKIFKRIGGYELLLTACKFNKPSIVKCLIENGVNINEIDNKKLNALMVASEVGNINIVKMLIENKIRINDRDNENKNALIYATVNGHLEVVQYLVQNKININVCSLIGGCNALFSAIRRNYKDIAFYLIDNGIDMYGNNLINSSSKSILVFAYECRNIDVIKYMVEKGVNLDGKHYLGDTILMKACFNNDIEMANFLIENDADINAVNGRKETALMHAIKGNNLKIVQLLVEKGINIHLKNNEGFTALLYASKTSTLDIVKYLISQGADIEDENNLKYNALILACLSNKFEIVKYLVEIGIDINHNGKEGRNALILGIGYANIEIIKYLVNHGIDINHTTKHGYNAAYVCVNRNRPEELKFLVENGIDFKRKPKTDPSPIDYAKIKNQRMYDYLKKKEMEMKEIELKKNSTEAAKFSCGTPIKYLSLE